MTALDYTMVAFIVLVVSVSIIGFIVANRSDD